MLLNQVGDPAPEFRGQAIGGNNAKMGLMVSSSCELV